MSKLDPMCVHVQDALDTSEWPRNWPAAVQRVLEAVLKLPEAVMFAEPVVMDEAPGYRELIANPMDLGTVLGRSKADAYDTPLEALADVRQVLQTVKQAVLQCVKLSVSTVLCQLIWQNAVPAACPWLGC